MKRVIRTADGEPEVTFDVTLRLYRRGPVVVAAARMEEPFEVETPDGVERGEAGEWLIRGLNGEFYPCEADMFEATYEPVRRGGA